MKPALVCTNKFVSRVERSTKIAFIFSREGSLNLRATEKSLEKKFFDEFGEIVKVKIRR